MQPRVQSLARGLALLLQVARGQGELTARELSERVGISRQAAYHLLHTLRETGFVYKRSNQRYELGLAVGSLIDAFDRQLAPPQHLMEHLQHLASVTGEACSIAGWKDQDVVILAHVPGGHAVSVSDVRTGQSGAIHARASGKLLLAFATEEKREPLLQSMSFPRLTPRTITSRADLERELDTIVRRGYSVDDEEFCPGISCVSALIVAGMSHFALTILAPTTRFHERAQQYAEAATQTAQRASARVPNVASTNR